MRWGGLRSSSNVEDVRGRGGFPGGIAGLGGLGTIVVVLVSLFMGVDPSVLLDSVQNSGASAPAGDARAPATGEPKYQETSQEAVIRDFATKILGSTEDAWGKIFTANGATYQPPKLVMFSHKWPSGCGQAQAITGPFYCPVDHRVYLDLLFLQELLDRVGAGGDFAPAYVIAHEVGHHVQTLLGTSAKVEEARRGMTHTQANALSVSVELQADCYAGVWAHFAAAQRTADAKPLLETGDIEEGLGAAAAVGDDRLQRQARGYSSPETFTHGTSAERQRWFKRGLSQGKVSDCNTFAGAGA